MSVVQSPVMLYTEQTPNPESLKFVTNRMLFANNTADFREEALAREWSPLGAALFDHNFVKGVYVCNNFVTVTKEFNYEWADIMVPLKQFVKEYVESGKPIMADGFAEWKSANDKKDLPAYEGDDAAIVEKIKNT